MLSVMSPARVMCTGVQQSTNFCPTHKESARFLFLVFFIFNGLLFSFRPHRSSTTCRNQEGSTELSFTHGSHQQKNPITTERLQGLLNAKNGYTAVFSIVRPTDRPTDRPTTFVSRFGLPHEQADSHLNDAADVAK